MAELERFLAFAQNACYEAGRLTLGYFYRSVEIISKADDSPVTIADREAELLVRRAIEKAFPDHGIFGEEHGTKPPAAGCSYTWYIDPIDGTKSFIHGVPLYSTLLALVRDNESVVGVIQLPATGEQVAAAKGLGCTLNGRPARCSTVSDLSKAVVLCSDPRDLETIGKTQGWRSLWAACRYPRSWGDGFGHAMVATGRAEIMLDAGAAPYDVAAMPVIHREAGGGFRDWRGEETIFGGCGVAANGALLEMAVKALRAGG